MSQPYIQQVIQILKEFGDFLSQQQTKDTEISSLHQHINQANKLLENNQTKLVTNSKSDSLKHKHFDRHLEILQEWKISLESIRSNLQTLGLEVTITQEIKTSIENLSNQIDNEIRTRENKPRPKSTGKFNG